MSNIVEKIKEVPDLYYTRGGADDQITMAEQALNITFPEEYREYLKEFGAISFYGTEWTGINVDDYLDVVKTTNQERDINTEFPVGCFLLENLGIDGMLIVSDMEGKIYSLQYDKKKLLCASLTEYLEICKLRNSKEV